MDTRRRALTPVGAVVRGLLAGTAGTLALDLVWFARYKREDGKRGFPEWEFSADVQTWEQAPAPAHVGKRLVEGLFEVRLPDRLAPLVNNVTHWGYGIANGAVYGIVAGSLRTPRAWYGLPFGAAVWGSGYVVLPAAGLYQPIWRYDRRTLWRDLSAHLVYGLTTAAVFGRLTPRRPRS
jgi:hypothetical protein